MRAIGLPKDRSRLLGLSPHVILHRRLNVAMPHHVLQDCGHTLAVRYSSLRTEAAIDGAMLAAGSLDNAAQRTITADGSIGAVVDRCKWRDIAPQDPGLQHIAGFRIGG